MSDTSTPAMTSAVIRFPARDGGPHTYHLGDEVTFTDKLARVNTGPIKEFEKAEGRVYVTVSTDNGLMLIELRRVLPAEFPQAVAMAEKGTPEHLACGTLVRVTLKGKPLGGIESGDLAVVIADKGQRVNVAKLGGHQDSYARVGHDCLTVVKVDPQTGILNG